MEFSHNGKWTAVQILSKTAPQVQTNDVDAMESTPAVARCSYWSRSHPSGHQHKMFWALLLAKHSQGAITC